MNITFYNFNGEIDEVNKTLTAPSVHAGHFKSSCDYLEPSIEFKYNAELLSKNYAYIPIFNGFYAVTGRTIVGQNILLDFNLDELLTFKDDIKNSDAHIIRCQSGNVYLPDNKIVSLSSHNLQYRKLGNGFTPKEVFTLVVAGVGRSS